MNNKELAQYIIENEHEDRDSKIIARAYLEAENSLQSLRDMLQVQCNDGNWNYDPYMHGMANGMIFALSLFEAGEPKYLNAPVKWLKDIPAPEKMNFEKWNKLHTSAEGWHCMTPKEERRAAWNAAMREAVRFYGSDPYTISQAAPEAAGQWKELYESVNGLMAHLGAYGEVDTRGALCERVMNALYAIDDGRR